MKHPPRSCAIISTSRHVTFAQHPLAAAMAAAFVTFSSSAWAQLPTGSAVVNGTAGIVTNGSAMTITNSPNAILNWQTFSIGTQSSVRFEQQNAASQVLNRVVGNDPSSILGSLSSNGGVWLVNPHGVLFGPNARVDVGGLVASTLGIANDDFLTGRFKFEGTNPLGGQVLNQGEINTTFGGRVWLMGDSVRNEGLIKTPGGNIVLAAGKSIELVDSGMPNVTVRVTAPENEALNLGSLIASSGGSIDVHGGIVNQQGIVRADSVATDAAGRVVIKAQGDVKLGDASVTSASAAGSGAGGKLVVASTSGTTSVNGSAYATSTQGQGGQVHLLGKNVGLFLQAEVDASGGIGGGEALIGGDYQGRNAAISNAIAAYLGPDATIKANATGAGDGGKVILWGNDVARAYGSIEARGGATSGNGGFIETSGGYLDAQPKTIDVGAPQGNAGTWLLDPHNITISATTPPGTGFSESGNVFTSTSDSSTIAASTIKASLDGGAIVRIQTGNGGGQDGNIVVASSISTAAASPGSLTLKAHNDIRLNAGVIIESTGGAMPVTLTADFDKANGGGVYIVGSTTEAGRAAILTNGGDIVMSGAGISAATAGSTPNVVDHGILINGGLLDAGAGNIKLTGLGRGGGHGVFISRPEGTSIRSSLTARDIDIDGEGITGRGVGIGFTGITASGHLTIKGDMTGESSRFGVSVFGSSVLSAADINITSNDAVGLDNGSSAKSGSGPLSITAPLVDLSGGSSVQGGAVSITTTDLELFEQSRIVATGSLTITGPEFVGLFDGSSIEGGTVSVSASDVELFDQSRIVATGSLTITAPEFVGLFSGSSLQGGTVSVTGTEMKLEGGSSIQGAGASITTAPDSTADRRGATMQAAGGTLLISGGDISIGNMYLYATDGRLSLAASGKTTLNNAQLQSDAAGDAITIATNSFRNTGSQLSLFEDGRWLIYLGPGQISTFLSDLGGLPYGFVQVNAPPDTRPDPSLNVQNGVLLADPLNILVRVNASRPYDGTAQASFNSRVSDNAPASFRVSMTGGNREGTFNNKNVGIDKPITADHSGDVVQTTDSKPVFGSTLTYVADITPKIVSPLITADNKVYDGTRTATVRASLSGVIPGDDASLDGATGLFDTKDAGNGKTVTIEGGALAGADEGNYELQPGSATTTADIAKRPVTAGTITAVDKVYDGTRAATLSGNSVSGVIAGDSVSLNGATGLFDTKNVGNNKPVTVEGAVLAGADAHNYELTGPIPTTSASITPKAIDISIVGPVVKEYDATNVATLGGVQYALNGAIENDVISVSGPAQGIYDTADVGAEKTVTATGEFQVSGADAPNYSIGGINPTGATNALSTSASGSEGAITPATLTYNADRAVRDLGLPVTGLTGNVTGFKGADNVTTATSGTLGWQSIATVESLPGSYSVEGTGLSAGNYVFTQAPGNATALVLMPINTANAPQQQAVESSTSAIVSALRSVAPATSPRGSGGGVFDISSPAANRSFGRINIASMSQEELTQLLEARKNFKRKLFADAIYKLEIDPSLADVQPCPSVAEVVSGLCRITTEQLDEIRAKKVQAEPASKSIRTRTASLPQIERKIAVLFGINDYDDKTIPRLENAVPDVDAVSKVLAEKLGYEVKVVRNPNKAEIIRTLNELSIDINASDSVVVYYAGHGYSLEKNGAGYWLPSDAPVNDPSRWISNSDIAKLLAGIRSKQMALISDSCYSGAFARDGMASVGRDVTAEDVLTKRSVVVLSSGGDEPVADEGKDGHSIFAWNLMKSVDSVDNWRPGSTIFSEVQRGVKEEFPQTPKYGSVTSAGHQQGGDYLFELR